VQDGTALARGWRSFCVLRLDLGLPMTYRSNHTGDAEVVGMAVRLEVQNLVQIVQSLSDEEILSLFKAVNRERKSRGLELGKKAAANQDEQNRGGQAD
jgi:hypothetical protein